MREGDIRKAHIMAERLVKFAKLRFEKPTMFEIGVGNGLTTKFIQNAGIDIEGVDIDKDLCEKLANEQHIRVCPGGLEKYPTTKQYDVVYSSHVIEHFDEPDLFMLKAKQLVKKDGFLYIDTPDLDCGIAQGKDWHHFRTRDPWEHACVLSPKAMLILATRHSLQAVTIELHPEYGSFQAILRKG
jgi:2-polyprenyl-3-methyl-5-hydroxy-6-metoxy-1,4-benzoquinol methylase